MKTTCKTCLHLSVWLSPSGRRIVRKDYAYPCTALYDPLPPFPESVTVTIGRRRMWGDEGHGCPHYVKRSKDNS